MTRRQFLRVVGLGALAAAGGSLGYQLWQERWNLELTERQVRLPGLPAGFAGLRVAHLTDLHLGRFVPAKFVRRAVELTRRMRADLVVVTGDFVGDRATEAEPCAEALEPLSAPLGVFATLGNHDVWAGQEAVVAALREAGLEVLINEPRELERGRDRLFLLGVNDSATQQDDLYRACHKLPRRGTRLLLAHSPDILPRAEDFRLDLVLAGHTHGGQVNLPWIGPPVVNIGLGREYVAGLRRWGRTQVYVSRGVGMIAPPIRFRCRPEVALLTLQPA
jgi:predicted MPP superfamily phosphohydrolase